MCFIDANGLRCGRDGVKRIPDEKEIKTAEAWIKTCCRPMKTINRKFSSYGLKHRAEDWGALMNKHFNTNIFEPYVSNGAFIQAAKNLGYSPYPVDFNNPNAYFRMAVRCGNI
jgi:hypothetical protein